MSVADELTTLNNNIKAAYTKVDEKGGTVPTDKNTQNLPTAIESIQTGGGGDDEETGVVFIDYEGTVIEDWTVEEAATKTALPDAPVHEGLTSTGWNWTLEEIQSNLVNQPLRKIIVGHTYKTTNGKTRFYMSFDEPIELKFTTSGTFQQVNTIDIDWGDGITETLTSDQYGTYLSNLHSYQPGDYVIELATDDIIQIAYNTSDYTNFVHDNAGITYDNQEKTRRKFFNSKIKKVELSENCTSDNQSGFLMNCVNLESVSIPNTYTGTTSSTGCIKLKAIVHPRSNTKIYSNASSQSAEEYISLSGNSAQKQSLVGGLFNSSNLKFITIPDGYTFTTSNIVIGSAGKVKTLVLPDTVTTSEAIYAPYAKTIICRGLTIIKDRQFSSCPMLEEVYLGNNISSYGQAAFSNTKFEEFTFSESTLSISMFESCGFLKKITLPEGVLSIPQQFCNGCKSLKEINIPSTVTELGPNTFSNTSSLYKITLPNGLLIINSYAFYYSSIMSIDIPSTVTSIGNYAFASCNSLYKVKFNSSTPPTAGNSAFSSFKGYIYIPSGSKAAYLAASNYPSEAKYYVEY